MEEGLVSSPNACALSHTHTNTHVQRLPMAVCVHAYVCEWREGGHGPTRREGRKIGAERGARYVPTRNVS